MERWSWIVVAVFACLDRCHIQYNQGRRVMLLSGCVHAGSISVRLEWNLGSELFLVCALLDSILVQ